MDEQKENRLPPSQCQPPACPYHTLMAPGPLDYDDDLSLAGLWRVLIGRWRVIVSTTIFSVIAAAGYLSVATPTYEAEVVLLPPEARHIEALNIENFNKMTSQEVYTIVTRNLRSNALRRQFFDENGLLSVLGGDESRHEESTFQKRFSHRLKVREGTRDQKDLVFVTLEGEHAERITAWLNDFVRFAVTGTLNDLVDGVQLRMTNHRDSLREHIRIAREMAQGHREDRMTWLEERLAILRDGRRRWDRIAVLDEQIAIARELNIMDRNDGRSFVPKEQSVGLSVSTAQEPMYLRGVKDLVAERESLQNREDEDPFLPGLREILAEMDALKRRTNDDPFIPGLRDKEEELARVEADLTRLQGSRADIVPARIDRLAVVPDAPASPKKTRILAVSLVAGVLLGAFAAFQVNALAPSRA